jgi:hypothetical protein
MQIKNSKVARRDTPIGVGRGPVAFTSGRIGPTDPPRNGHAISQKYRKRRRIPHHFARASYRRSVNSPLTKREIESLTDQLLALIDQIDSGDLRATPGMRHRMEGALIGLDISLGRSLEETLESFRGLDKRAE